jgi:hypothetical protein
MNIPLETTFEIISKQTITSFNYRVTDIILFKSATSVTTLFAITTVLNMYLCTFPLAIMAFYG